MKKIYIPGVQKGKLMRMAGNIAAGVVLHPNYFDQRTGTFWTTNIAAHSIEIAEEIFEQMNMKYTDNVAEIREKGERG